jgi:hypothetical protein
LKDKKHAIKIWLLALSGVAVMLRWNAVAPALLGDARQIDYLHVLGLLVLCRILFGGFRGHGGWHRRNRWNKWQSMTPEAREQFHRRGPWGRPASEQKAVVAILAFL